MAQNDNTLSYVKKLKTINFRVGTGNNVKLKKNPYKRKWPRKEVSTVPLGFIFFLNKQSVTWKLISGFENNLVKYYWYNCRCSIIFKYENIIGMFSVNYIWLNPDGKKLVYLQFQGRSTYHPSTSSQ